MTSICCSSFIPHHLGVSSAKILLCTWQIDGASQVLVVVTIPRANVGDRRDVLRSLGWEDPLE